MSQVLSVIFSSIYKKLVFLYIEHLPHTEKRDSCIRRAKIYPKNLTKRPESSEATKLLLDQVDHAMASDGGRDGAFLLSSSSFMSIYDRILMFYSDICYL